jgi:hypothetical protein
LNGHQIFATNLAFKKITFQLYAAKLQVMKKITILLLLLSLGTFAGAQTMDTVVLVSKAKRFAPSQHILLMFELVDTIDATGAKATVSRSYYFDKRTRMISSVREYSNPGKPEKGTQVIYSFGGNKLSAVTVIPPRSTCRNCESKYYYFNDALSSKQENSKSAANSAVLLKQGQFFQSKLPHELPWGFFDDEVIVNGEKKKVKKTY